jgi:putative FmdB family regulatory protein
MPIYEFYCPGCHTVFSFFSKAVDTEARPDCPKCKRPGLERKPSTFATLRHGGDEAEDPLERLGEENLDRVLESMAGDLTGIEEGNEDPRALAGMFRRIGEAAGLEPGPRLAEMLARLEAGEDPDSLEEELGGDFDEEDAMSELFLARKALAQRRKKPRVDDTLYFL